MLRRISNIQILVANETYRKMKEYFEQLYDIAKKAKIRGIDENNNEKLSSTESWGVNSFRIRRV